MPERPLESDAVRQAELARIRSGVSGLTGSEGDYAPELDQRYLDNLDQMLALQESKQTKRLLDEQEERGFFRSGNTQERLVEEVLGPSIQRRQAALIPLQQRRQEAAREERLGALGFERQRQTGAENFERELEMFTRQANLQRQLMELRSMLDKNARPGFGEQLAGGFASGFGGAAGKGAYGGITTGIGSLF